MKTKYILMSAMALTVLTACEDYTDKNFGTRDELYQPTEVRTVTVDLVEGDYANVAANATNRANAEAAGLSEALESVGTKKYFRGGITPDEYLIPILQQLVGKTQYYTLDAGSSIVVNCLVSDYVNVDGPAYVPTTKFKAGKYLLVPQGQEQVLGTSGLTAEGAQPSYGYLYLTGGDKCPAINRISDAAITIDSQAKEYLYTFDANGEHFTIRNAAGYYLYLDGSHASFQYTDDLASDLDDEIEPGLWDVTAAADGTYDIVNVATGQQLLYDTSYKSAGCYSADKRTDSHQPIVLYQEGKVSVQADGEPEVQSVVFQLDEDGWAAKADYINMPLTAMGSNTTDANTIFDMSGWSIEAVGGIGELTYVWRLDPTYGLRASAYANSTYTPVDVWAISPAMNLKKAKQPLLRFDEAQKYCAQPIDDYLQVWVSTDYAGRGGQAAAKWTNVTDRIVGATKDDGTQWQRPDGSDWTYATMTLDLSDFAGQPDVRVAFRYISSDTAAATWEVKNVVCKEAE